MSDDLRVQERKWFVETGYVDGGGMGYWSSTKESVEVGSEAAANALRDEWLKQGKLERTHWGELRPTFSYGTFRIRSIWVDVSNPLADRIEELEQRCNDLAGDKINIRSEILELEAKLSLRTNLHGEATHVIGELEAKLEKAMEALEGVRSFVRGLEPYADQGHTLVPALKKACDIYEELKGENDDH